MRLHGIKGGAYFMRIILLFSGAWEVCIGIFVYMAPHLHIIIMELGAALLRACGKTEDENRDSGAEAGHRRGIKG